MYFRLTIPETPRFTLDVERNIRRGAVDIQKLVENRNILHGDNPDVPTQQFDGPKAGWQDFWSYFSQWKNLRILFGSAYSWFALDVRPLSATTHTATDIWCRLGRLLRSWFQLREHPSSYSFWVHQRHRCSIDRPSG